MFTVSNQNSAYCILNDWCICINMSCGVLEAPIPNMSLGDKTSLHVISISSDKTSSTCNN